MEGQHTRDRSADADLGAAEAAETAIDRIAAVTGGDIVGATSVEPSDDGWQVEVEIVEEHRIPSSADMLGLYEVDLDQDGVLLAYRRTRRYARGQVDRGDLS